MWLFDDILNYIDDQLNEMKSCSLEHKPKILTATNFIAILLENCNSKEIFCSYDVLSEILRDSTSIEIKYNVMRIFEQLLTVTNKSFCFFITS